MTTTMFRPAQQPHSHLGFTPFLPTADVFQEEQKHRLHDQLVNQLRHYVSNLCVSVGDNQKVILRGHAPSYHFKQIAQEAIFALEPEIALSNQIAVA